jgi:FkbM family methyltransferase
VLIVYARRLRWYQRAFGPIRGLVMMVLGHLRPDRTVDMHIGDDPQPVTIRLGWSDVGVWDEVVVRGEYDFDLPAAATAIVDAGANVGVTACWYAWRYPGCRVVAVEPEPSNFALLAANAARRPAVTAVRAAVWPASGTVRLLDPHEGAWAFRVGSADARGDAGSSGDGVAAVTLDGLLAGHGLGHVDLLKVDVEGAELDIFRGPLGFLDRVDAVAAELHDHLRPGCTRAFFAAVADFPVERRRGNTVLVARTGPEAP